MPNTAFGQNHIEKHRRYWYNFGEHAFIIHFWHRSICRLGNQESDRKCSFDRHLNM